MDFFNFESSLNKTYEVFEKSVLSMAEFKVDKFAEDCQNAEIEGLLKGGVYKIPSEKLAEVLRKVFYAGKNLGLIKGTEFLSDGEECRHIAEMTTKFEEDVNSVFKEL